MDFAGAPQVIVMEHTWKSQLKRRAMAFLRPNPFFYGVVRMLMADHEVYGTAGSLLAKECSAIRCSGLIVLLKQQ